MLIYRRLHEMILIILMIGIINIYDIIKNINISIYDVIRINEKNIIYLLLITLFFFFIFFHSNSFIYKLSIVNTMEFELILGLGLIGLFFLILSNDFIFFFLALELYSLSVYLLLFKNNPSHAQISILYFLLGSISSSLILLALALFYKYSGSLNIEYLLENIEVILTYHHDDNNLLLFAFALFIIGLLFKLGAAPFQFWVVRVYSHMDLKILIYQSIVPKIVYIYILYKLLNHFPSSSNSIISLLLLILLFSAFLSLFIGPIGGLNNGINQFKRIIAYSSILHVGYLLLGLVSNYYSEEISLNLFQYLIIYGVNTFQLLLAFLFLQSIISSLSLNIPLLFSLLLFSVFSFIGLPPFAGFYGKLNIILNCLNTNNILLEGFAILFIIVSTLISLFIYLKFINMLYLSPNYFLSNFNSKANTNSFFFSYLLSFLTFFLLFYSLFLPYFSPLFDLLSL